MLTLLPSLRSRLLVAFLRATKRKAPYSNPGILEARIAAERTRVDPKPPRGLRPIVKRAGDLTVYEYGTRGPHVLYLHGGSFVFEIAPEHHRFCAALAATGRRVSAPIYPLAPECSSVEMQARLTRAIGELGPIDVWMGDSAGGGLALSLAQIHGAKNVVLLSPWLDIALGNPDIVAFDQRDPWLSRPGLVRAGEMYAGGLSPRDPRVSPIHGNMDSIERISIFIGTRDLFCPDARRFRDRAPAKITLFEYEEMVHDFMLIRALPEARRAFREIVSATE